MSRAILLAVLAASACGGSRARPNPPPPPEAIVGTWGVADGSDVVMRIGPGTPPVVEAFATADKVAFEISGVSWDGRRLKATFRYPPTGVTTTSDLVLVSSTRLEGTVSGAYEAHETWLRIE